MEGYRCALFGEGACHRRANPSACARNEYEFSCKVVYSHC
jgi:hypothetical protein